jgi:hypothetical protein
VSEYDRQMEEERYRIPLFAGSRFDDWKFRMESLLDEKDMLPHVQFSLSDL